MTIPSIRAKFDMLELGIDLGLSDLRLGDYYKWYGEKKQYGSSTIFAPNGTVAKHWYCQAGNVFEALMDQTGNLRAARGLAAVNECLGLLEMEISYREKAEKYLDEALSLRKYIAEHSQVWEDQDWIARVYTYYAIINSIPDAIDGWPQYEKAYSYMEKAISLLEKLVKETTRFEARLHLAKSYFYFGDLLEDVNITPYLREGRNPETYYRQGEEILSVLLKHGLENERIPSNLRGRHAVEEYVYSRRMHMKLYQHF